MLEMYDNTSHIRVVAALAPQLQFIADTLDDVVAFLFADPPASASTGVSP